MSKVRSAKGEIVDFDLLKIKQQMQTTPKPVEVKAREDFIEKRLKRRQARQAARTASIAKKQASGSSESDSISSTETAPVRKTKLPSKED
jgi:ribosomal protein S21